MRAVVSGRAALALLQDGDSWQAITYDNPEQVTACSSAEVNALLRETQDLLWLDDITVDQARDLLYDEVDVTEFIDGVLQLLDGTLRPNTRDAVVRELDELAAYHQVVEQAERILLARPFPGSSDFEGALATCTRTGCEQTHGLLLRWQSMQSAVEIVVASWRQTAHEFFSSEDERTQAEGVLLRHGVFSTLAGGHLASTELTSAQMELSQHRALRLACPQVVGLLNKWIAAIRKTQPVHRSVDFVDHSNTKGEVEELDSRSDHRSERRSIDRGKVKQNVDRTKERIGSAIRAVDRDKAKRLSSELIAFQLENGGSEFACKSLCDLAIAAQECGDHQLQLWLTSQSVEIGPDDGWSWAQHGQVLLQLGRFYDADHAFQNAESFGDSETVVVAKNGRAEVLKAMGRFTDGLTAFDEIIEQHPQNVVAWNGRAEVLKAMGRLTDALTAFDEIIEQHPLDVVARNGRAEVLKAMGRFADALTAFDEVIEQYPQNVVARNGRAGVLKAMGRFTDALTAFDAIIEQHPQDVVARNGRAEALKAMGRFTDALSAFDEVIEQHPQNAVAKTGRATVLLQVGRLDEALRDIKIDDPKTRDEWIDFHVRAMVSFRRGDMATAEPMLALGATECPFGDSRPYFESALALVKLRQGRFDEARQFVESKSDARWAGFQAALRVHVYGELGNQPAAQAASEQLPQFVSSFVSEAFVELRRRYVQQLPPAHSDDWLLERECLYLLSC